MQAAQAGAQTPPREGRSKAKGLQLNMQSTQQAEQEARMLASNFPSPSDKMLSPISRALGGGRGRKMIFGAQKPKGRSALVPTVAAPAAPKPADVLPGSASRPDTSSNASIMQRKAQRQAFLSGSKTQTTQSRLSEDSSSASSSASAVEAGAGSRVGSGASSLGGEGATAVKLFSSPQKAEPAVKRSIDRSVSPSSGPEAAVKTDDENALDVGLGPQAGVAGSKASPALCMKPLAKSPRANA